MSEAQNFMQDVKQYVDELVDYTEWTSKVMESDKPIILDCYADWCQPCRKLTPILEDLTMEHGGKFKLVKLNIDNLPQLASGLKVRSIPAVFLVHKGGIIDTFVGVPSKAALDEFIKTALVIDSLANDENVMQDLIKRTEQYLLSNQFDLAEKLLVEGLSYETWRDKFGPQLYIGSAFVYIFGRKDVDKCRSSLALVSDPAKKKLPEFYKDLMFQIENEIEKVQQEAKPDEEELKLIQNVEKDPTDMESRFTLAQLQWKKNKNQEAIQSCLDIVKIDRNWNNRMAYNLLIEIFNKLGASNEIVMKARKTIADRIEQQSNDSDAESVDSQGDNLEPGSKKAKMPKKSRHRMRAHINPMGDLTIPVPLNPDYADWSEHYPSFFGIPNNNNNKMVTNTGKYPISYANKVEEQKVQLVPTIVDIGCGYGGLLFELSKEFPQQLILGMEIRDKLSNFVVQKINTMRINSGLKDCMNITCVRTNTMKTMHNYFYKESLEKMFFCFADPHFKKVNHRRRIINTSLLSDYAYSLKQGGKLYVVTDVKDLFDWEVQHLEEHPLFEKISDEENEKDVCIKFMRKETDEAKKVIRNEGSIWHAVFRKRNQVSEKEEIDKVALTYFL